MGKSTGDRARLFDSESVAQGLAFQRLCGFSVKFVTTLADLRGDLGFRIVGYVLIPQDWHLRGLLKQRGDRPWSRSGRRSI